jgi:hypothetical protein
VTSRRYSNYRQARSLIDELERSGAGPTAVASLGEMAETLLLSRSKTRDVHEGELDRVAGVLHDLVELEVAGVETAVRLWRTLLATGPPAGAGGGLAYRLEDSRHAA